MSYSAVSNTPSGLNVVFGEFGIRVVSILPQSSDVVLFFDRQSHSLDDCLVEAEGTNRRRRRLDRMDELSLLVEAGTENPTVLWFKRAKTRVRLYRLAATDQIMVEVEMLARRVRVPCVVISA